MLSRRPREKKSKTSKLASFKGLSIVFSFKYPFLKKMSIFLKKNIGLYSLVLVLIFKSIIIHSDFE